MKFILKQFGQIIKEVLLEEGREYFIGRSEECDFVISPSQGISRKHIKIHFSVEEEAWMVNLMSSGGGLYLDQEEVEAARIDKTMSLGFENYVLEFVKEGEEKEEMDFVEDEEGEEDKTQIQEDIPQDHSVILAEAGHVDTGSTKIMGNNQLIHSLHISIEGEFSDYVTLKGVDQWLIGRSEDCDISIDYSILTRKHMEIFRTGDNFYIKDLGSANKTLLNGQELSPNQPVQLRANDEIAVCDLCIIFEVRDKKYEQKLSMLPTTSEESSEYMPEFAAPKVILEEEDSSSESKDKKSGNKLKVYILRAIIFLAITGATLAYIQTENKKKEEVNKAMLEKIKKEKEEVNQLKAMYDEALAYSNEQKFLLCIEGFNDLHEKVPEGFNDSKQKLAQCHDAERALKQKEEEERARKEQEEAEKRVAEAVAQCVKEHEEGLIKTVSELDLCVRKRDDVDHALVRQASAISNIQRVIEEKDMKEQMERKKKEEWAKTLASKRALYYKAQRVAKSEAEVSTKVKAFNRFIRAAGKISSLKKLKQKAQTERDAIQKAYDDELQALVDGCVKPMKEKKYKEAYPNCKKVLDFRPDNEEAQENIEKIASTLEKEMKPDYERSVVQESFANIKEAKEIWQSIVKRDIAGGRYYKKAKAQLEKYDKDYTK